MSETTDRWMVLLDKSPRVDMKKKGWKSEYEVMDGQSHVSSRSAKKLCFARVDEMITFKPHENSEYNCFIRIRNVSKDSSPIIFKIKTTFPEHYRVFPTIAVIEGGGVAKVTVTSHPNVTPEEIQQDRFLVQVCALPGEALQDDDDGESVTSSVLNNAANFGNLNETFKRLTNLSVVGIQDYKVAVFVESKPPAEKLEGLIDESSFKKELEIMKEKIVANLDKRLAWKLKCFYRTIFIILILVLLLFIRQIMQLYSCMSTCACAGECDDQAPKSMCPDCGQIHNGSFLDTVFPFLNNNL